MAPSCPGHHGDTGGGQHLPPTVIYVWHACATEVAEQDVLAHIKVQEGSGAETMALGGGGGAGGHLQVIQSLWAPPQEIVTFFRYLGQVILAADDN